MKVVINVGHSRNDPGCKNKNFDITEFEFNDQLSIDIENAMSGDDITLVTVYQDTYSTLAEKINGLRPDLIISLHCNAFNEQVKGCEILCHRESEISAGIADIMLTHINSALHNTIRGIKQIDSNDRGGRLLLNVNAPAVICEPFFLDNDEDYENARDNYDALVEAYRSGILESCESLQ